MNIIPFCDICGKILIVKKIDKKSTGVCSCGFMKEIEKEIAFPEKIKGNELGKGASKEQESPGYPHECEKCGYNECDVVDLGAPYGDESNIYLYRCKKCKYVERQADGSSNN